MTSKKQFALVGTMVLLGAIIMPTYAQLDYGGGPTNGPSNAQQNQVKLTDKGSIKVGFYTDPAQPNTGSKTKFYISFINKDTDSTQQHVDYKVFVKKGTDQIFGIPVTHTAEGSVTVPFQFTDVGPYQVTVEVDGILFQPIPPETATFTVGIETASVPEFPTTAIILVIGIFVVVSLNKMRIFSYS